MNDCPVTECDRRFDKPQGLALHITRVHPDYDRNANDPVDLADLAAPTDVELAFSVIFGPDELVLLQALTFLKATDLNSIAAEAFEDLFRWAREQEGVATLVALREQWVGGLVDGDATEPATELEPGEADAA